MISNHICPDCPYCDYSPWNIGDKVQRKMIGAFRYDRRVGEVVLVFEDRLKIKWETPASTGQQHSTVQMKYIEKIKS